MYGSMSLRFPAYNLCCTVASDRLIESLDATVKSLDLIVEGAEELPGLICDELCVNDQITNCQNGELIGVLLVELALGEQAVLINIEKGQCRGAGPEQSMKG